MGYGDFSSSSNTSQPEFNDVKAKIACLNYDEVDSVSKLQKSQRYIDIMKKVEEALENTDNRDYEFVVDCNALLIDIENEIDIVHNFIRDKYRLKFPELESLLQDPIDFARVVKKFGNETDPTLVSLEGLVPPAMIMVISVTASTTSGKPLPEDVLEKTIEACDRALVLDAAKKTVLDFLESRMEYMAPNLCVVVGSAVAAKLVGIAGGLVSLANMPACNVKLLGASKNKSSAGYSTQFPVGYLEQTELFQSTPPPLRKYVCRLLANKAILSAGADLTQKHPTGKIGRKYREEIRKTIKNLQEPPPAPGRSKLATKVANKKLKKRAMQAGVLPQD